MSPLGQALSSLIWLCILVLIVRWVMELVIQFSRSWRPSGGSAVLFEVVYTVTDPPLKLFRRLLPPLRIGGVALDLSFLILLIVLIAVRQAVAQL